MKVPYVVCAAILLAVPSALAAGGPLGLLPDGTTTPTDLGDLTSTPQTPASTSGGPFGPLLQLPPEVRDPVLAHWAQPDRVAEPRFLNGMILAHFERQGLFPHGFVQSLEAAADGEGSPEDNLAFRFAYPIDDINGDGVPDTVVNSWNLLTLDSTVSAVSGTDGTPIWEKPNLMYIPLWLRRGDPFPQPTDNFATTKDVNGDNVGDLLLFGFQYTVIDVPPAPLPWCVRIILLDGTYRMMSGKEGSDIWVEPYAGEIVISRCTDPQTVTYLNFPTGLLYFDGPKGPRVAYKTTDIQIEVVFDPTCYAGCVIGWWVRDTRVTEHIHLLDAAKNIPHIWDRDILPTENPEHAAFWWFTGAGQLDAAGDLDLVLDGWYFHNPQFSEIYDPITGNPIVTYGRGMVMQALNGDDGKDLWKTTVFVEPPVGVNPPAAEEPYPVLIWTGGQLLEDMTGDGAPEPVGLYLTADVTSPSTVNGIFRTNFAPLNGKDGQKLWPQDQKYIGWGFAANLNPPGTTVPYLSISTVDIPTAPPPGGRFPPKDVHQAVLNIKDGTPAWSLSQRYSQDSYVVWHMTLDQFMHSQAPYDWNKDGIRDLVTPSQYIKPSGAEQTLLSTATHTYQILSGADGEVQRTFKLWGSLGQIVSCGAYEGNLTIATGHSRRIDYWRFDGSTGESLWRQPIYNDPKLRPATAGVDLIFFNARCMATPDTRVLANLNMWTYAIGTGFYGHTLHAIYGDLKHETGLIDWLVPALEGNPPLKPSFYEAPPVAESWLASIPEWGFVLAPAAPGAAGGIALSYGLARRRNGKGGKLA